MQGGMKMPGSSSIRPQMVLNKCVNVNDNPDLTEERLKSTFDTDEMAYVVWQTKKAVDRRREISSNVEKAILRGIRLDDPCPTAFMGREELYENAARKMKLLAGSMKELDVNFANIPDFDHLINEVLGYEGHPLALHAVMFIPALAAQADDEQQSWWLQKAVRREIIGTYAQTELGHGSNLRNLETTATYDREREEFVLHSPTTTSLKWWPGNLGKSVNFAIVTATMMIDGKNFGPHNFFVQLRDTETHQLLTGVETGDIGPKMEFNAMDNGFLRLTNVRIPRRHMLMRHSKVASDGAYTAPSHSKMAYATMVHVRTMMIAHQANFLAYTLCTAIRYSAIRRQGELRPGAGEVKIMEYQTQQHRLFPQLARAFAFLFAGYRTRELYAKVVADLKKGKSDDLADLHALTSGLKSVVTYLAGQGMEQARMACGGHGYSKASGIPQVHGVAIGGCTYEGENMVMLLQLARYLMKAAGGARRGQPMASLVSYLVEPDNTKSQIGTPGDKTYSAHLAAFAHIARRQIFKSFDRLEFLLKSGQKSEEAWNNNAVEMQRAARLHTRYYIARAFYEHVETVDNKAVRDVLSQLLHLHLNYELIDCATYLCENNYLNSTQLDWMKNDMYRLLAEIRPNAVSIVDSWDFSDRELRSVLGRKDGHVYENLYKWAKQSQLNREEVTPVFEKHLKPMMEKAREQSKL